MTAPPSVDQAHERVDEPAAARDSQTRESGTRLLKQPHRRQQPDPNRSSPVATAEIETPECARLVKPARALKAATRFDERPDVASDPDANRSEVFFLWLSNGSGSPAAPRVRSGRGQPRPWQRV